MCSSGSGNGGIARGVSTISISNACMRGVHEDIMVPRSAQRDAENAGKESGNRRRRQPNV